MIVKVSINSSPYNVNTCISKRELLLHAALIAGELAVDCSPYSVMSFSVFFPPVISH